MSFKGTIITAWVTLMSRGQRSPMTQKDVDLIGWIDGIAGSPNRSHYGYCVECGYMHDTCRKTAQAIDLLESMIRDNVENLTNAENARYALRDEVLHALTEVNMLRDSNERLIKENAKLSRLLGTRETIGEKVKGALARASKPRKVEVDG